MRTPWMQNLKRGFHHYELSTTSGPFTTGPARDSDAVTVTDIVCDRAGPGPQSPASCLRFVAASPAPG